MSTARRSLRMVLAVGGPLHGRYLPDGPGSLLVSGETSESVKGRTRRPCITYRRRRLSVPGWRLVLDVYTTWPDDGAIPDGIVLPGHVTGVPGESEPLTAHKEPIR